MKAKNVCGFDDEKSCYNEGCSILCPINPNARGRPTGRPKENMPLLSDRVAYES